MIEKNKKFAKQREKFQKYHWRDIEKENTIDKTHLISDKDGVEVYIQVILTLGQ